MKNNLFLLTKVLVRGGNSIGKNGKKNRNWVLWLILGIAFLPMIGQLAAFTALGYDVLKNIEIQTVIPAIIIALSSFVVFFFGIFYVLNTFYFTQDIESLLPLPLRPFEILGAKFIVVTIYEYLTEIVVLLPVLVVYGIKSGGGVLYYLYSAVIFLIMPVIPLVISSLIIMPLMRFTGFVKNKDRFKYFVSIFALGIGLGVNAVVQKYAKGNIDPETIQTKLEGLDKNVDMVTTYFPSAKFAALGLINNNSLNGVLNIFLFILISCGAAALFLFVGQLLYFKGVMGISDATASRKKISGDEFNRKVVHSSAIKTYLLKEFKILIRTPIYFINCILMNFIWPVFMLIPLFSGNADIGKIREFINGNFSGLFIGIGFGFIMFLTSTNGITATSISREGKNLYINRYIPFGYKDQIIAKVLSGIIIGLFGIIIMIIVVGAILGIGIENLIYLFVVGLLGLIFSSFTGIMFDLLNPKLDWDNEQKAVKQNLNLIFNMLVGIVVAVVSVLFVFLLGLTALQAFIVLSVVFVIIDVLLYVLVSKVGVNLYKKIEQ